MDGCTIFKDSIWIHTRNFVAETLSVFRQSTCAYVKTAVQWTGILSWVEFQGTIASYYHNLVVQSSRSVCNVS